MSIAVIVAIAASVVLAVQHYRSKQAIDRAYTVGFSDGHDAATNGYDYQITGKAAIVGYALCDGTMLEKWIASYSGILPYSA